MLLKSPLLIKFCKRNFCLQHTHSIELSLAKLSKYLNITYIVALVVISIRFIKMMEKFDNFYSDCDYGLRGDCDRDYDL